MPAPAGHRRDVRLAEQERVGEQKAAAQRLLLVSALHRLPVDGVGVPAVRVAERDRDRRAQHGLRHPAGQHIAVFRIDGIFPLREEHRRPFLAEGELHQEFNLLAARVVRGRDGRLQHRVIARVRRAAAAVQQQCGGAAERKPAQRLPSHLLGTGWPESRSWMLRCTLVMPSTSI